MPEIVQNTDQSAGFGGYNSPNGGGFVVLNAPYNASSIDLNIFVATRRWRVKAIAGCPSVAGSNGSAVTAAVVKTSGTTAVASGTALHASTYNLKGTADTVQTLTLTTTGDTDLIEIGDRIGINYTGTLTDATGVITVVLAPA